MAGQFNDPVKDAAGPSACDNQNIKLIYCAVGTPVPTPTPATSEACQLSGNYWSYAENSCKSPNDCENGGGTLNFAAGTCDGGGGWTTCAPPFYYDPNFDTSVYVGQPIGGCRRLPRA